MSITSLDTEQLSRKIYDYFNKYNNTITEKFKKDQKTLKSLVETKKTRKKMSESRTNIVTGDNKKLSGTIEFKLDNENKALTFFITSGKTIYREDLYLPIYISLQQTINKINNKLQSINNEIMDYLEYGDVQTSGISIKNYKLLKRLIEIIQTVKSEHLKHILVEKNNLFQLENKLLKQDKELYNKAITLSPDLLNEYFLNHFQLEQPNKNTDQPILVGTKVYLKGDTVVIENIDTLKKKYKLRDGRVVSFGDVKAIPAIRNLIYNLKTEEDMISVSTLIDSIRGEDELLHLFLDIVNINYKNIEINRPYTIWSYISKEEKETIFHQTDKRVILDDTNFVPVISRELLYSENTPILIGTSKHYKYEFKNIGDDCRYALSLKNTDFPTIIDDFTFLSPLHYHKASQFYNRQDLIGPLRAEYNDFYLHFTKEYDGQDTIYNMPLDEINDLTRMTSYRKYYLWDKRDKTRPSISSLYLRKALYHFISKNPFLRDCLLSTENCILYEKVKKYTFRVYYELMEVRYFIMTDQIPYYADYNYDIKVRLFFDTKHSLKINISNKNLMEAIIETDAYNQRYNYLKLTNPIEPILDAYKLKDPSGLPDTDFIYDVLFSYKGDYYYNLVVSNKDSSFEKILVLNPDLKDDIVSFSFIYILAKYLEDINDESMKKQIVENEEMIKKLQIQISLDQTREIDIFRSRARSQKYIPDVIAFGLKNSLYQAVANSAIRQNKYPVNFTNLLDKRDKLSSIMNTIRIGESRLTVYNELELQLSKILSELYSVNRPEDSEMPLSLLDLTNTDYNLQIELLSRYFGADITIITKDAIDLVSYNDIRLKYPQIISGMVDYLQPTIHIVIGRLETIDNLYFVDLIPDFSQKDAIIDYLYDSKSNIILKELDDESQEYIGIWDPIELTIKYNESLPEINEEELDMEVLRFYLIGTRLYYGQTEIY